VTEISEDNVRYMFLTDEAEKAAYRDRMKQKAVDAAAGAGSGVSSAGAAASAAKPAVMDIAAALAAGTAVPAAPDGNVLFFKRTSDHDY